MSNYIQISVTIGISADLEWLNILIDHIYAIGPVYVYSFDESLKCEKSILLVKSDAVTYLKKYMQTIQASSNFIDYFSPIFWVVEGVCYEISIIADQDCLRWSMYLLSNKKCKDQDRHYTDFQYYILLHLDIMKSLPILEIATDEECRWDDLNWSQKEGKWWGLKVRVPQPKENFQMLDVIIDFPLSNRILQQLVEKASVQGNKFFPVGFERNTTQEILTQLANQTVYLLHWKYVCSHMVYDMCISPMSENFATRLFFRTLVVENLPYIDLLVKDALKLINDNIILQFVSFDSRYNYLISK
jgi:hypothetical protein